MARTKRTLLDRFLDKVSPEPNSGCWLWVGTCTPAGYGLIQTASRARGIPRVPSYAHRVSYELFIGAIPEGLELDHLCRVRCCVNPAHLDAVTRRENCRRGICAEVNRARQRAKTHCKHGHAFDDKNTWVSSAGYRHCKECCRIRMAERRKHLRSLPL